MKLNLKISKKKGIWKICTWVPFSFQSKAQDRNECIWIFFKNAVLKEFREMIKIDENVNI